MVIAESLAYRTFPSTEVTWEPRAPKVSECAASVRANLTVPLAGATAKDMGAYDEHAATKSATAVNTATILTRPGTVGPSHPKLCSPDRSGFSRR